MTQFSNQLSGNILGQSTRNKKLLNNIAAPDTDSREIELVGMGVTVTPDVFEDHSRMKYTVPVGNVQPVTFNVPVHQEDRSLFWLLIDNSNNTGSKVFTFGADYNFLDDPTGNNIYTVTAGSKLIWYGCMISGEVYLRVASTSTN